jgi:hypothetical protein
MYEVLIPLHSLLRWAVIAFGLLAAGRGLAGWLGRKDWLAPDQRAGLLFVVSFDVQVLVGLVLYLVVSPITTAAFGNMGAAMQDADMRFWVAEHLMAMLLGLVLAHVGRVRARAAAEPVLKHRRAAVYFGFALLLVLTGVPWPFTPVSRPMWPW